jgi:hypothetical protein
MQSQRWLVALALGSALFVAACDDDDPAAPALETFSATVNGANERPNPTTSTATGNAQFTLNRAGDTVSYTLTVNGLSAGASNAHIHWGIQTAVGTAPPGGNVIVPLAYTAGATAFTTTGKIAAAQISNVNFTMARLLSVMRTDSAYVNVHTSAVPAGEVRGQVTKP